MSLNFLQLYLENLKVMAGAKNKYAASLVRSLESPALTSNFASAFHTPTMVEVCDFDPIIH